MTPNDFITEWVKDPADRMAARRDLEYLLVHAEEFTKHIPLKPKPRKVFASWDDKAMCYVLADHVTQEDLDAHKAYELERSDFDHWERERRFREETK